jgi:hypothetical protein
MEVREETTMRTERKTIRIEPETMAALTGTKPVARARGVRAYVARALLALAALVAGCDYDLASVRCADPAAVPLVERDASGEAVYRGCYVPLACPPPAEVLDAAACEADPACVRLTANPDVAYAPDRANAPACTGADWSGAELVEDFRPALTSDWSDGCLYAYEARTRVVLGDGTTCDSLIDVTYKGGVPR